MAANTFTSLVTELTPIAQEYMMLVAIEAEALLTVTDGLSPTASPTAEKESPELFNSTKLPRQSEVKGPVVGH